MVRIEDYTNRFGHTLFTLKHKPCKTEVVTTVYGLRNYNCVCPKCRTGWKTLSYKDIDFIVQGVEDLAIDWLVTSRKVKPKDIIAHSYRKGDKRGIPVIDYVFEGKKCKYYPDFYIHKTNTLIEVKSPESLGVYAEDPEAWFYESLSKLKAKATKVKQLGYNFKLLVFSRNKGHIELPSNWIKLSKTQLRVHIES